MKKPRFVYFCSRVVRAQGLSGRQRSWRGKLLRSSKQGRVDPMRREKLHTQLSADGQYIYGSLLPDFLELISEEVARRSVGGRCVARDLRRSSFR